MPSGAPPAGPLIFIAADLRLAGSASTGATIAVTAGLGSRVPSSSWAIKCPTIKESKMVTRQPDHLIKSTSLERRTIRREIKAWGLTDFSIPASETARGKYRASDKGRATEEKYRSKNKGGQWRGATGSCSCGFSSATGTHARRQHG